MRGNATAGILLLLIGAAIITFGVSPKGKAIFDIITDKTSAAQSPGSGVKAPNGLTGAQMPSNGKLYSGGENILPGTYAGETGASALG